MDLKLQGKSALVSGSTAGIGFAVAQALAQEGASTIIVYLSSPLASATNGAAVRVDGGIMRSIT